MKTDKKIITYEDLASVRKNSIKTNKKIVLTTGCFDLLHLGHLIHLNFSKKQGDILVVAVGNDKNLRLLKGPSRPIYSENIRARLLAALEVVDYIVISEESGKMDHNKLVELLLPDIYVVPGNDSHVKQRRALVEGFGGTVVLAKRRPPKGAPGISTTATESKLKSSSNR